MSWYSFIFTNNKPQRTLRHISFWLLWWIYFVVSNFHYEQTGIDNIIFEAWNLPFFIKSFLHLSIQMAACYFFIDWLMPKYLFIGKYLLLIIGSLFLCVLLLLLSYALYKYAIPLLDSIFNYTPPFANTNIWWTSITSGLLSAPKVIMAAATIKLIKRWYFKQKEKERLEKEKLLTELQLLKTQMHPPFIFSLLDNIASLVQKKEIVKPALLLLKLSDILSYMLYELDETFVPLEKEIKAIENYVSLEKNKATGNLETSITVEGAPDMKLITPMLLFSLVEKALSAAGDKNTEINWINIKMLIEDDTLDMKLIHGKSHELEERSVETLAIKQLDYFYPGKYELKDTIEPDMMMTHLKLILH
ncbi:MAG: hypothetical protein BGO55_07765 [Sphingobacteriales bacterium 50-39]|nr:histidine kinase [Sphingobacteriales bacterium]OJW53137.1 MAG: hypothetical protein BGO55_07765 [Sphingobacteriales bacterium 50-39]